MRKPLLTIVAAAAFATSLHPASLPNYDVDQKAASRYDFSALRARVQKAVDTGEIPGGSVLVMQHGKVVFKEAFGLIDIENNKPFRTDSVCAIASSTKWISGATLMAAVSEGKLSLDDPIGKYFPAYADMPVKGSAEKGSPTVRQCFSHTNALPEITDNILVRDHSVLESAQLLAKTINTLDWMPGSAFRYGNTGMQLVGGAVAKVTGMEFQDYMREKILAPLGMRDTSFNPTADQRQRSGGIYVHKQGGGFQRENLPALQGNIRGALVAGGLHSTLDDYARFLTMMLNDGRFNGHQVLPAKAALETQKDQTGGAPIKSSPYRNQKGYGLGAAVMGVDASGKPIYIGDGGAFGTYGWIDRDQELIGVFFTQNRLRDIYNLSMVEIRDLVRAAADNAKH
ncbi:MAG: beta-lactamase family protein [Acidobacteriia bacterium]|nr:beta-lactamase family protein [Terriglobia bacterium]